jgi:hypothetical protein
LFVGYIMCTDLIDAGHRTFFVTYNKCCGH